jgi:uncharacterized protein (DUF433 family)
MTPSTDYVLPLPAEAPPLQLRTGGVYRVTGTRVSLDTIVEQYENGMSPKEMAEAYPTLDIADIHRVIAYYLCHRDQVQAYLKCREEKAAALRARIEAEHPRTISRAELVARRAAKENGNASPGQ